MIPRPSGLTLRIAAASLALALPLAGVFVVLLSAISHLRATSSEARESERLVELAHRSEQLLIDLETGQRGFVITQSEQFLQPYLAARRALPRTLAALQARASESSTQRKRAKEIAAGILDYEHNWAARMVRVARRNPGAARRLIATAVGKRRVDHIRGEFATFLGAEQRISDSRRARAEAAGSRATWLGLAGLAAVFAVIIVYAGYLMQLVVRPVRAVARCARRLAQGDLSAQVPVTGAGEVGELGRDFNTMARELARQYSELQAVLDATFDSILMTDTEGNVLFANAKMARFWADIGLPDEGTVWDRLVQLASRTTTPDAYFDTFARIASDPMDTVEDEFTLQRDKRTFVAQTAPVIDSSDQLVGRIFSVRDITAERQSERAKEEFVAAVSHELRTPLTSVHGYVELLLDGGAGELTDEQRAFLNVVDRNALRLRDIVGDLLFIAQAEVGSIPLVRETVDIVDLVEHSIAAARPLAEDRGIELTYEGPRHSLVDADPTRISQIVDNLVANAIKFTRPDTTVTVRVAERRNVHVLEVTDEGLGIDAEDQQRLFERFFRTAEATTGAVPGTGLGLSIVKAIVDAHEGTIDVLSEVGTGTTFRVELPRVFASRAA